jgi:divalent metal cation (Fe/Co/Zn/Cd) transporter
MDEAEGSAKTVFVAAGANLVIAVAKAVAALLTGSAATFAERLCRSLAVADAAITLVPTGGHRFR